jgi:hypothetical protein
MLVIPATQEMETAGSLFEASTDQVFKIVSQKQSKARHLWLTPAILATQEVEIRRVTV